MGGFRDQLTAAEAELSNVYEDVKADARRRLGRLFNAKDYPSEIHGLFIAEWEFPSVEPPSYLMRISPEIYEEERRRVAARFDEAVRLAEQAFATEFARILSHLTERLTNSESGERRVFRDSAVSNLTEFFERFRHLNVRSNPELDALVDQARDLVKGVAPQELRDNTALRQHISTEMVKVQSQVEDDHRCAKASSDHQDEAIGKRRESCSLRIDRSGSGDLPLRRGSSIWRRSVNCQSQRASHVEPDESGQWWADLGTEQWATSWAVHTFDQKLSSPRVPGLIASSWVLPADKPQPAFVKPRAEGTSVGTRSSLHFHSQPSLEDFMSTASPVRDKLIERNLLFLSTPSLWPTWPFLPLIRHSSDILEEYGVLYDCWTKARRPGYRATVFFTNIIFELPTT